MKSKILYVLSAVVGCATLHEPSIYMVATLTILLAMIFCFGTNKIYSQSGVSKLNVLLKSFSYFIPFIIVSTICYLVGNSGEFDYVFNLEDKGLVLNIIIRGLLYVVFTTFICLLLLPFCKYYEVIQSKKVKNIIVIAVYLIVAMGLSIYISSLVGIECYELDTCTSCIQASITTGIIYIALFSAASVGLGWVLVQLNNKINFR